MTVRTSEFTCRKIASDCGGLFLPSFSTFDYGSLNQLQRIKDKMNKPRCNLAGGEKKELLELNVSKELVCLFIRAVLRVWFFFHESRNLEKAFGSYCNGFL